jgi:ergothioneine biosynthesis protein EgtB
METADGYTQHLRRAGKDLLSLALMDARNRTLRWLGMFEQAPPDRVADVHGAGLPAPVWRLGHIAWFQERWIARNVHRQRGEQADPTSPRLASILPDADVWYDPAQHSRGEGSPPGSPGYAATRQYLADTIDLTLDLLEAAQEDDAGLYFFRLAVFFEDMQSEALAETAQALQLPLGDAQGLVGDIPSLSPRPALLFPATRWQLGSPPGGFVFDNEKWAHEVAVPEFEIDAQPVTWSQFGDFVEDGGYDDETWWSEAGREWLRREGRRAPAYVDQLRYGVLQERFGRLARVPMAQPALHVSWHEAQAWCRWAGRRLPTEVEWEVAAHAASRGYAWGAVWEWTASTFRPYAGYRCDPWRAYSEPHFGTHKVLRGASFATPRRLHHPKFRRFATPEHDRLLCGFRSCAA